MPSSTALADLPIVIGSLWYVYLSIASSRSATSVSAPLLLVPIHVLFNLSNRPFGLHSCESGVAVLRAVHFVPNPAAFVTLAHFAISSAMCSSSSFGGVPSGSNPSAVNRSCSPGSFAIAATSRYRRLTMSAGVFAGASSACQFEVSKPDNPDCETVGMSGRTGHRLGPVTAIARSLPPRTSGNALGMLAKLRSDSPFETATTAAGAPL